ncbi:uncharacterized protein LOC134656826 [Cydia amplana]|uniref:uncharacterized protein LOC134656826 n=1 Tax=Cydia amplana TaxID=1869771 RepID=UPI002FE5D97D
MFSVLTNMVIMYVDIVLLLILLCLILTMCTYCVVRIRRLQQNGQVTILLRPTKVMFSHKNEENGKEELRTVVAYQNPFTGDYCVNKSRPPKGYLNALSMPSPESTDSGVSEEYEPLRPLDGRKEGAYGPFNIHEHGTLQTVGGVNSVNKTWNWNYKEYQI